MDDLRSLSPAQRDRVARRAQERRPRCPACGQTGFAVGDGLPLSFLFHDAAADTWMVALTCRNPSCPVPHTGITLRTVELEE